MWQIVKADRRVLERGALDVAFVKAASSGSTGNVALANFFRARACSARR